MLTIMSSVRFKYWLFDFISNIFRCLIFHRHATILSDDDNTDDYQSVIDTNFAGLVNCTKFAFQLMKKLDDYGHIININSIYGHGVPIVSTDPRTNVYSGTKHAITATTEIIRQELNFLKNKKVRVSVS